MVVDWVVDKELMVGKVVLINKEPYSWVSLGVELFFLASTVSGDGAVVRLCAPLSSCPPCLDFDGIRWWIRMGT